MLEIDGSYGSGGGQLLRTAIGLSAITGKAVKVTNIRAGRPKPGLEAQHLAALNAVAQMCNAEVHGAKLHSQEISFSPRELSSCSLNINIGTAGSIPLLLQAVLLPALKAETKLRINGGTDVSWSPSVAYMQHVFFPVLKRLGANFEIAVSKRGYFPKGNGAVSFKSSRAKLPLKAVKLCGRGSLGQILVFSHSSNLPPEVSSNQCTAASGELSQLAVELVRSIESNPHSNTTGSGIDLIAEFQKFPLGANALGKKGKPAVDVGREAASKLLTEISFGSGVDPHLADQIIPFMALASGLSEISCNSLSKHALTNIFVAERFLDVRFSVEGTENAPATIRVEGCAFS